jgi:hypothetical protein
MSSQHQSWRHLLAGDSRRADYRLRRASKTRTIGDLPSYASGKGPNPDPRPHPCTASGDPVFTIPMIENSYVHLTTNAAFIQRCRDSVRGVTTRERYGACHGIRPSGYCIGANERRYRNVVTTEHDRGWEADLAGVIPGSGQRAAYSQTQARSSGVVRNRGHAPKAWPPPGEPIDFKSKTNRRPRNHESFPGIK